MADQVERAQAGRDHGRITRPEAADIQQLPGEAEADAVRDGFLKGGVPSAIDLVSVLSEAGGMTLELGVGQLQQTMGNRAVQRLFQSSVLSSPTNLKVQRQQTYYVIGDRTLNVGGGAFLATLDALKPALMRSRIQGNWTLVISIHGSQNYIANSSHGVRGGRGSYDAAAIESIFANDAAFVEWRNRSGPNRVVLNACQASQALEGTIIRALSRPPQAGQPGQPAQGLGTGCRPSTSVETYEYNGRPVRTRRQFNLMPPADRPDLERTVRQLNTRWGYFGAPPVPDNEVLNYYFDVAPRGGWPVVRVSVERADTDIAFYNRGSNPAFHRVCTQGIGQLPERTSGAPRLRSGQ